MQFAMQNQEKNTYVVGKSSEAIDLPTCLKVKNSGRFFAQVVVEGQLQSMSSVLQLRIFQDKDCRVLLVKEAEYIAYKSPNAQDATRSQAKDKSYQVTAMGRSA
jgi:hypothetical protein